MCAPSCPAYTCARVSLHFAGRKAMLMHLNLLFNAIMIHTLPEGGRAVAAPFDMQTSHITELLMVKFRTSDKASVCARGCLLSGWADKRGSAHTSRCDKRRAFINFCIYMDERGGCCLTVETRFTLSHIKGAQESIWGPERSINKGWMAGKIEWMS